MDLLQLEKIGLKEKEAKVYIALLKEGPSLANHIAKKTDILRSSIYDYLDVLSEKGFISYTIKSGKKYFQATNPRKIIDNFNEKKEQEAQVLKEIISELKSLQGISPKNAKVEVFEGKEGMKTAMSLVLKEKPKEILIYGSSGVSFRVIPFYMGHWHKERIKKNIFLRIIYNDVQESHDRIKKEPTLNKSEIRFSPIKNFSLTGTILFNNFVLITMWNPETPIAIAIESKEISKDYKNNFETLWKIANKQ